LYYAVFVQCMWFGLHKSLYFVPKDIFESQNASLKN